MEICLQLDIPGNKASNPKKQCLKTLWVRHYE
jgi:hypothetical protein